MFTNKRVFQIAVAVGACLAMTGCVPVLIGGAIYHSSQTNSQRAGFNGEFQKNNLEREVKGLKPLDWCTEAYKFDAGWAKDKPECTERVTRYESGDRSALSM